MRGDRSAVATFFCTGPIAPGGSVALGAGEAHHARVRRIQLGERVRLVDGAGTSGWGRLVKLSKGSAAVDVQEIQHDHPPPAIHLMVPVADRDRMLWLAEKATELELTSWRPVSWRHSQGVRPRGEGVAFQDKVRARMTAALTQSGGSWLPILYPDAPPERAISAVPPGARFLLDAEGLPLLTCLTGPTPSMMRPIRAPVTVALGPEGGVESHEREDLLKAGFTPVALASRTLRFETAGIASLAILRAALSASLEGTHG